MSELEGLRRCARVGGNARDALAWLTGGGAGAGGVRLVTTRGTLLAARVAFAAEHDAPRGTNDDRVLATALNLHLNLSANTAANTAANTTNTAAADSADASADNGLFVPL